MGVLPYTTAGRNFWLWGRGVGVALKGVRGPVTSWPAEVYANYLLCFCIWKKYARDPQLHSSWKYVSALKNLFVVFLFMKKICEWAAAALIIKICFLLEKLFVVCLYMTQYEAWPEAVLIIQMCFRVCVKILRESYKRSCLSLCARCCFGDGLCGGVRCSMLQLKGKYLLAAGVFNGVYIIRVVYSIRMFVVDSG